MVEFIVLAVLLLIPLIYLVMFMGRLQAGTYAVSVAARESGRAYVSSPRAGDAPGRAQAAASLAFADQGFADGGTVTIACDGSPCLRPEGRIASTARVVVPLPLVPAFARSVIPLEVPVSATHVSTVDRFGGTP
ncbi:MAG: pilus assembly protein [Nostocoides sp.]